MSKNQLNKLLTIGIDNVAIASSAKKAGYEVCSVDYFCDMDLRRICSECEAIVDQKPGESSGRISSRMRTESFLEKAHSLIDRNDMDAILLSSGLDDSCILHELNKLAPILGNPPEVIERVRAKPGFFEELDALDIPFPKTKVVANFDEAIEAVLAIGYPVVVKPVKGFGGIGIGIAQDQRELKRTFEKASMETSVIIQEFVEGKHASISFLGTSENIKVLTVNEQILGASFLFQPEIFGYCGNTAPLSLDEETYDKCVRIVEEISRNFGLKGSNGIDVVISKDDIPYVVEVNPRFQGSLECIEQTLGTNIVEAHINACIHNSLPSIRKRKITYYTRLVLYAPARVIVPDLTTILGVRDVPLPETIIEKGEPLCSVITGGTSQRTSFHNARKTAEEIYDLLQPVPFKEERDLIR
ncbi:MAG: ATP-grasp domain-containing protein [Candidatus Bathyarchaeota archaeon]|jgi:hypothetical protein